MKGEETKTTGPPPGGTGAAAPEHAAATPAPPCGDGPDPTQPLPDQMAISGNRVTGVDTGTATEVLPSSEAVDEVLGELKDFLEGRPAASGLPPAQEGPRVTSRTLSLISMRSGFIENLPGDKHPINYEQLPGVVREVRQAVIEVPAAADMELKAEKLSVGLARVELAKGMQRGVQWFVDAAAKNQVHDERDLDTQVRTGVDKVRSKLKYNTRLKSALEGAVQWIDGPAQKGVQRRHENAALVDHTLQTVGEGTAAPGTAHGHGHGHVPQPVTVPPANPAPANNPPPVVTPVLVQGPGTPSTTAKPPRARRQRRPKTPRSGP